MCDVDLLPPLPFLFLQFIIIGAQIDALQCQFIISCFSSSRDNVLNVWDLSNNRLLKTIPAFEVLYMYMYCKHGWRFFLDVIKQQPKVII